MFLAAKYEIRMNFLSLAFEKHWKGPGAAAIVMGPGAKGCRKE